MNNVYGQFFRRCLSRRKAGWILAGLAFFALGFPLKTFAEDVIHGQRLDDTAAGNVINFSELAASDQSALSAGGSKVKPLGPKKAKPKLAPPKIHGSNSVGWTKSPRTTSSSSQLIESSLAVATTSSLGVPSPPPSASFEGLISDTRSRNPDTAGAVGPNHLMITLNSQIRIQNRQGGEISTVTLDSFWAGVRPIPPVVFDPRVIFDPFAQRFIFTAEANPTGTNTRTNDPGLLIAVSQTSDPTGNWNRYFIDLDTINPIYADSPNVGFNKDWIVVQADTFLSTNCLCGHGGRTNVDEYFESQIFVFNKANLYAGGSSANTRFTIADGSFAHVPAVTYDEDVGYMFLMTAWTGNAFSSAYQDYVGWLRIYSITGSVSAPIMLNDNNFVTSDPGDIWADYTEEWNFLPQLGTTNRIVAGDARLQNVVFRNSSLWTTHTEFVPADTPTHTRVGFWEVFPGGTRLQKVFLNDASLQTERCYPSIAVNHRSDVVVGYSLFGAGLYPSAAYFFQAGDYTASGYPLEIGRYRDEMVLKAGESPYVRLDSLGRNFWGDWSATCVDGLNDMDLWTLQEYAATPINGTNRWGTWWGRISPLSSLTLRMTDSPAPAVAGGNLTYTISVSNSYAFVNGDTTGHSGVRLVDPLPSNVSFVSAVSSQGSCGLSNNIVVCDIGTLRDGVAATATIVVRTSASGFVTNTASVSAFGPDRNPSDNVVTLNTQVNPAADLIALVSASPSPVTVTSNIVYSIIVTNLGPSQAGTVNVTNTLPPTISFVSVQSSMGACTPSGNIVRCSLGTLNPANFALITITGTATAIGQVTNSVIVSSASSSDPFPANNSTNVVTRVNSRPSISAIGGQAVIEDGILGPISFVIGDAETASSSLALAGFSSSQGLIPNGNITFGGAASNRTVTITPLANQFGPATISIVVTDLDGGTATTIFNVTVNPANDPPTLDALGTLNVLEDQPQTVNLTGIGSGAPNENQTLTISAFSGNTAIIPNPAVSYTSPDSSGTLSFTPVANVSGSTTITVTINDGGASNNISTRVFTVNVSPVNDPPTLAAISDLIIAEEAPIQIVTLTGIGSGAPNETQTLTVSATSSDTSIIPNPSVSYASPNATGSLSFTPLTNAFGTVTITVTVNDGAGSNNIVSRTFNVTVNPVNDRPTLNTISSQAIAEDTQQNVALSGITSGAANENQILTVTAVSSDTSIVPNPTVTYTSPDSIGSLAITSATNAAGSVTITVTVNDGIASNNIITRTFTVSVNPVNDPPSINPINDLVVVEDAPLQTVNLTGIGAGAANESSQTLAVTASSSDTSLIPHPNVSYASPNATGSLSFTPVANNSGTATITVTVTDNGTSNNVTIRTFTVTVGPVNDLPTLNPIGDIAVAEDSPSQTIPLSGIGSGAANETQTLTVSASSSDTSIVPDPVVTYASPNATGSLSLTSGLNSFGTVTITIRVDDGGASNNIALRTFLVTVNPVNDPPTLAPIADVSVDEDSGARLVNLSGISSGAGNEVQTLSVNATSSNPQIIPNPTVTYTSPNTTAVLQFTPATNAAGEVIITVNVNDGGASNNLVSQTFRVTVNPINDMPTISRLVDESTLEDFPITLPFTVGDVETLAGNLMLQGESSNDELISAAGITFGGTGSNRTVTIRPLTNQFGSATITVTVSDGEGGSANTSFELFVDPVNDAPGVSFLGPRIIDEDTGTGPISFTISDPESPADDVTVAVAFSRPDLVPNNNIVLAGNGANWSVSLMPLPNVFGTGTVSIILSDLEGARSTNNFVLGIRSVNDLPAISSISTQTIDEDTSTAPLSVTISDLESPAQSLTLSGSSSDPTIVPDGNITFTGTTGVRAVTVKPATNQNGNVIITIAVHDPDGGTSFSSFPLTIRPVNDPPAFSTIPSQVSDEDVVKVISFTVSDPESAGGGLTVTASSSNPALVPDSNLLVSSGSGNRTLTVTPILDQAGSTMIQLVVRDPQGLTADINFALTIRPVNDPPTLAAIADITIAEDSGPRTVDLSGISSGAANEPQLLILSATSNDTNIIANIAVDYGSPNTTGTLTFAPVTNATGVATITVSVNDGGSSNNITSRTFDVTVTGLNDPPSISPIPDQGTDKGAPLGPVNVTIADPDGVSNLTVSGTSSNTGLVANAGIVVTGNGATRSMTITPLHGQIGSAIITLTVRDPQGLTAATSFRLTVNQANDRPSISGISNQTVNEDASTAPLAFVVGDQETPAASLTVSARCSNPQLLTEASTAFGGSGSNRTVRLTPNTNQSGTAMITLTVRDADGMTASTSFSLTVMGTNDPPFLGVIGNQTINEDSVLLLPLSLNDVDSNPASLTLSATSSNTVLVPNANIVFSGTGLTRSLQITPTTNEFGSAPITVTLSDGNAITTQTFVLTVTPVNEQPTLNPLNNLTISENAFAQNVNLSGISSGAANENQTLTVFATSGNPGLIPTPAVGYASPNSTGILTFTPVAKSNGTAVITVTVSDGQPQNGTISRSFTVTVNPVNDGPTISAIASQATPEDVPLTIPVFINDVDTSPLSLLITTTSSNPSVVLASNVVVSGTGANRSMTITPVLNATGTTTIGLNVSDGVANTNVSFVLTVNPVNDPPTLNPLADVNVISGNQTITVTLTGISSGASNETQTLTVTPTSSNTSLLPNPTVTYTSPSATGTITLKPSNNGVGTSIVTVTVSDGASSNNTVVQRFVFNARIAGNAVPAISQLTNRVMNEDTVLGPIPFTISDSVTPATLLTLSSRSSNPQLVSTNNIIFGGAGGSRNFTITPSLNQTGVVTITLSVTDTNFGSVSSNFVLTVNALNDAPTISPISSQIMMEDTVSPVIPFTIGDAETPAGSLTVTASSSNPGLVPNANIAVGGSGANRGLIITPLTNQFGASTITVNVSDGTTNSTVVFALTVNPANDLPTIAPIADQTTTEETPTAPIAITIGDLETAAANLTPIAGSSVPSLVSNFSFGGSGANRTLVITPAPNQSGTATITVTVTDTDGGVTNTAFLFTVSPANDPPTLDPINNLLVSQDAGAQNVNLSGIGPGSGEVQNLAVTASSSNPDVVPNPTVNYASPATSGSLSVTPVPGTNGTAVITVTVNDGQSQSNTVTRSFTVTVNDKPFISSIADQVSPRDFVIGPLPFTVGDQDTPAASLALAATSSNPALIPNSNILLEGTGSNRTVRLTPVFHALGNTTITISARDNSNLTNTRTFEVQVVIANTAPTLNPISDVTVSEDSGQRTVNFTGIGSGDVSESQVLGVIATSSNPALIPHPVVTYSSPNSGGSLAFTPVPNAFGNAMITVTVGDGGTLNTTTSRSFMVTVTPLNDGPQMAPIGDYAIDESSVTAVAISLADIDTPASGLTVTGISSDQSLVPNSAIVVTGSGYNRTARITPTAAQWGSAMITLTVSDGALSASRSFNLAVRPVDMPVLRIDRMGADVILSWPASASGFVLESKSIITGPWALVPEMPFLAAGRYFVTQPASGATRFYQLSRASGPQLRIIASGPNVTISWPSSVTGYILESSPLAGPQGPWTGVPTPPTVTGNVQSVTVARGPTQQFFRLRK